jgi:hypothetical protein
MNSAFGRAAASRASLNESPGDVSELDDLVALVMMTKDEEPISESCLGSPGALHERWIGGRWQVARTLDASL